MLLAPETHTQDDPPTSLDMVQNVLGNPEKTNGEKKPMQVTQLPCWMLKYRSRQVQPRWLMMALACHYDTHLGTNLTVFRIQHGDPFIMQDQSSRHMSQIETMKGLPCEALPLHLPCLVFWHCWQRGPRTPSKSVHGRESQGCRATLAKSGSEKPPCMHVTPF